VRESRDDIVRAVSRGYAMLVFCAAALSLLATALLVAFARLSESVLVIRPGLGALLGPFIWRQKVWAMLVALGLAVGLRFMFGNDTELVRWTLTGCAALFAVLTGVRLWLANAAR
jgi:hypothetical protein